MMHSKKSGLFLHNWLPSGIHLQWTSVNYVGFAKRNRILNIDPGSLIWSMNWGACFQGAEEDTPEVWLPRCITWNLKVDGDEHLGDHLACHVIPKLNSLCRFSERSGRDDQWVQQASGCLDNFWWHLLRTSDEFPAATRYAHDEAILDLQTKINAKLGMEPCLCFVYNTLTQKCMVWTYFYLFLVRHSWALKNTAVPNHTSQSSW